MQKTRGETAQASFEQIAELCTQFQGPNLEAAECFEARNSQLTKPLGALGRLEEVVRWLALWQGSQQSCHQKNEEQSLARPSAERVRTAVFAANHGICAQGISAYPSAVTQQMVQNFISGGAAVNQLCAFIDADLKVYELGLEQPTQDFSQSFAMSEAEAVHAMSYGMMAVEDGLDLLCLGEMGIGNTTSAAALCLALFGGTSEQWTGRGTGLDDAGLAHKQQVIAKAVEKHAKACAGDPWKILTAFGGFELCAIIGAIIAARIARVPVLLDGYICTAAAAVLHQAVPGSLDHCMVAHSSQEPGHKLLLEQLNKRALLDLDLRLGEASGATLAVTIVQAAVATYKGMKTFAQAGVSGPES